MLFLRHERPEITAATRWFMEPVDYLTMRFSATASATHASRLASWLTDNRRLSWLAYDEGLVASVGLDTARLPPLRRLGDVVGTVCPEAAQSCGLTTDALVVTGVPDLHAAALGTGATRDYETHLALSTTSWISCPVPTKKTDVIHAIAAVPGLSNDSYLIANNQETGARALEWFQSVAGGTAPSSLEQLTALAALSPSGARGVRFTPWLAGERSPIDAKALRAGFTDLAATSTSADLVRAVLEGVAANSAWLFAHVERFAGRRLDDVRLLGGGAQSDLWCQIYADTLERRVRRVHAPLLAQVRGVTRLAAAALTGDDAREIARRVNDDVFEPHPGEAERSRARVAALRTSARRDRRRREPAERGVS
jgi:xylulokinase